MPAEAVWSRIRASANHDAAIVRQLKISHFSLTSLSHPRIFNFLALPRRGGQRVHARVNGFSVLI